MLPIEIVISILTLSLPVTMLGGACLSATRAGWPLAQAAAVLGLLGTLAAATLTWATAEVARGDPYSASELLSGSPVSLAVAVLVAFLAWVILRYSHNYLRGEPGQARYLAMLQLTVAAVALVILTDHLLVLAGAWVSISLGLHQLLLFYPNRPRAVLAAHKKFLLARTAEACLLGAVALLWSEHHTWQISAILSDLADRDLTTGETVAAVLLAVVALVKCAQLPVHGWLIQVVEAPTPVSALLHAGIINLGGYLLILFAPLFAKATAAQWLVLVVGGLSAVLAGLVTLTRVSIKVKLAWSTCAQMGLMLVECALGLFDLALLHLIAHACYKAHGFLNSGSNVLQDLVRRMAPASASLLRDWLVAAAVGAALVGLAAAAVYDGGPLSPWLLVLVMLTLVIGGLRRGVGLLQIEPVLWAAVLLSGYLLQKLGSGLLVAPLQTTAGPAADGWVVLIVLLMTAGYVWLRAFPHNAVSRRLWVWLFAAFYLDEWVTRTTMRLWPQPLPAPVRSKRLPESYQEIAP
jgi:NAD(P)H-quinone oxidoreductase subunit 5